MASKVDICNRALLRLGQAEIQSVDEASNEAQYCRRFYDICRRATLRAHPWNFATARAPLAKLSTTSQEYSGVYALPSDCVRALSVLGGIPDNPIKFAVVARTLETDMADPVLKYITDVSDPNLFDEGFADALAWRLAAELAVPITGKADLAQYLAGQYRSAVQSARAQDMNEGNKPAETNQSFIDARG